MGDNFQKKRGNMKETCAVPGIQLTDEIRKVITNCPSLFSSYSDTCEKFCPLCQVCRDYWECKI